MISNIGFELRTKSNHCQFECSSVGKCLNKACLGLHKMPKVFGGVPDQTAFQDMLEKQGGTSDFT